MTDLITKCVIFVSTISCFFVFNKSKSFHRMHKIIIMFKLSMHTIVQGNLTIPQVTLSLLPRIFRTKGNMSPKHASYKLSKSHLMRSDQKIGGNSFQPIGGLITGNCIHQGIRRKVTVDVIGRSAAYKFLEFSDMCELLSLFSGGSRGGATGVCPPPKGRDSFVLTYKFYET